MNKAGQIAARWNWILMSNGIGVFRHENSPARQ
jgi:hypothetical protein